MKRTVLINLLCSLIAVMALIVAILFVAIFGDLTESQNAKLVISSESATAVYNGEPLTNNEWNIVSGELKEGHNLSVEVSGVQTEVGISERRINGMLFLSIFATSKLKSNIAIRLSEPHTLESQKLFMFLLRGQVFVAIKQIDIFKSVKPFIGRF